VFAATPIMAQLAREWSRRDETGTRTVVGLANRVPFDETLGRGQDPTMPDIPAV
jgi:hypothetical protein